MLPDFPTFKGLEIEDKRLIEPYIAHLPPYSDFQFGNLWSWNILEKTKLSVLNSNLVLLLYDTFLHSPLVTFIGSQSIPETANTLIEYSKSTLGLNQLGLVPLEIANELQEAGFTVVPDEDNNDYVFSVNTC